jgi:membrane fusion protein (multidrug efflux system)
MIRTVIGIVVIVLATALVGGVMAWTLSQAESASPPAAAAPPVDVVTETVRAIPDMADTFSLPAAVAANRVVQVAAEVPGRVENVARTEGDRCKPGDLLVELNTDLPAAEVTQAESAVQVAEAALAEAEANLEEARREKSRIADLFERGASTERERDATASAFDRATAAKAVAEANIRESEARLRLAKVRLARARIRAPVGGVLNDLPVEKGEYVNPGDPIAEIVELDPVKVVAHVSETDVPFLKPGDTAAVEVELRGERQTLTGPITFIDALADERTRATRVEITLDNPGHRLRSGTLVTVRLRRRVLRDVILVPLASVVPLEAGKAVYVVEDGHAQRRPVEINTRVIKTIPRTVRVNGHTHTVPQQRIQVTRGLRPGDRLIVTGQQLVAPGQPVTVAAPATSPAASTGPARELLSTRGSTTPPTTPSAPPQ